MQIFFFFIDIANLVKVSKHKINCSNSSGYRCFQAMSFSTLEQNARKRGKSSSYLLANSTDVNSLLSSFYGNAVISCEHI